MVSNSSTDIKELYKKALAECHIKKTKDLTPDNLIKVKSKPDFNYYYENSSDENNSFFKFLEESFELASTIKERNREIRTSERKIKDLDKELLKCDQEIHANYIPLVKKYKSAPVLVEPQDYIKKWITNCGIIVILGIIFAIPCLLEIPVGFLVVLGASILISLTCLIAVLVRTKKPVKNTKLAKKKYADLSDESFRIRGPIRKLRDDNETDTKKLQDLIRQMKKCLQ